jgi:hypothetical protein
MSEEELAACEELWRDADECSIADLTIAVPRLLATVRALQGDAHRLSLKLAEALDCPYVDEISLLATARKNKSRAAAAEAEAGKMRAALAQFTDAAAAYDGHFDDNCEDCLSFKAEIESARAALSGPAEGESNA